MPKECSSSERHPSSQPAQKAGCLFKALFRKGQGARREAAPIHGGQTKAGSASVAEKGKDRLQWGGDGAKRTHPDTRGSQVSGGKPFVIAGL